MSICVYFSQQSVCLMKDCGKWMSEWPSPGSYVPTPMECCYCTLAVPNTNCCTANSPPYYKGCRHTGSLPSPPDGLSQGSCPTSCQSWNPTLSLLFTPSCISLRLSTSSEAVIQIFYGFVAKEFQLLRNSSYGFPFELFCIKLLLCFRTLVKMHTHIYIILSQSQRDTVVCCCI